MKPKNIFLGIVLLSIIFSTPVLANSRPNIVVIMADDLDANSLDTAINLGWMPNLQLDIMAEGVSFANSFVNNSLCCPSRATFLSGQCSHNDGVLHNNFNLGVGGVTSFNDKSTIAIWLKKAGYRTGHVGKYLNGYGCKGVSVQNTSPLNSFYIPPGWDDWQALVDPSTYNTDKYIINDNRTLVHYGIAKKEYQTDVLANRAVAFIEESGDGGPFFLVVTPIAPHGSSDADSCKINLGSFRAIVPHQDDVGKADNIGLPRPRSFNEKDATDKPAWFKYVNGLTGEHINCIEKVWRSKLESLLAVDRLIGKIVSTLENKGELANTVIIFTSDNGFLFGEHRLTQKTFVYEESIRVPLIVRAPGCLRGGLTSRFVINTDLAATIADFGGARGYIDIKIDGRSFRPLLSNLYFSPWRKQILIEHYADYDQEQADEFLPYLSYSQTEYELSTNVLPTYFALRSSSESSAVMDPNKLYVEYQFKEKKDYEYYNLTNDPYQLDNVYNNLNLFTKQKLRLALSTFKKCGEQRSNSCQVLEDK